MSDFLAARFLLQRYLAAIKIAWQARRSMETPGYEREDAQFLPAALALRDVPVHPAPRATMLVIVVLVCAAIVWACVGTVDVVATAPGKIVPTGEVKTIQSQDTAVVEAIHVRDGQHVAAGDALVDLDATDASTDEARARSELAAVTSEAARGRLMLAVMGGTMRDRPRLDGRQVSPELLLNEQHILDGEYEDFRSNVNRMRSDVVQADAGVAAANGEISKIEETLPIEQHKLDDYTAMEKRGYVGRHDYYAEQQAVIQMTHDISIERAKRNEASASLETARQKLDGYVSDARRSWLEKIHDDDQKIASLSQDIAKASRHGQMMRLTSPVDGSVQQLAIHTVGGVVTPAQTVMTIVPSERKLTIEAIVDNQDIGFIHEGQEVAVKIETFPFTRYGTLRGTVERISEDARQDEKLGLIFMADIRLDSDRIRVDGKSIRLTPGMAVTTEIKTGRRSLASYVLSPLAENVLGSFHER
jgi:hemolysin D